MFKKFRLVPKAGEKVCTKIRVRGEISKEKVYLLNAGKILLWLDLDEKKIM